MNIFPFFNHLQRSNSSWFLLHPNVFVSSCELSTASATSQSGWMEPVGTRCYGWMFDSLRVFPQKSGKMKLSSFWPHSQTSRTLCGAFGKKGDVHKQIHPLWVSINHSNHLTPTSQNKNKCPSASASGSGLESILPTDFHLRRLHEATCVWLPCLSPTTDIWDKYILTNNYIKGTEERLANAWPIHTYMKQLDFLGSCHLPCRDKRRSA